MCAAFILLASMLWLFPINKAENPSYDQGVYKPEFLNYCYEDRDECKDVCGCMLDRKCMVRPVPPVVMESILDKHNAIRKDRLKGDPKASGMPKLDYDAQLEEIAQCWAAKCRQATTDCLLTESYSEVGMNVGMIKIEEMNTSPFLESPYSDTKPLEELWKTILDNWSKEIDTIQFQQEWTSDQKDSQRGAQMVHDQTLALGCSWSASPEGSFFFCVYGPALKNGTLIYKAGPQCSTCPPGLKCTEDSGGLCVRYSLYPSPKITRPPPPQRRTPPPRPGKKSEANVVSTTGLMNIIPLTAVLILY
ncbi:hypothetical protein HHI36_011194 [Cryptolaemus montrouzieri]|uniref:SCP domain-containing protein n=1 Tax=Cryptolaemus montrouzieri TaxID=559131 RepID=A0ABD2ML04_9CUCU